MRESIAKRPDAEWAWLWRTRLSVLDYLIQRYAPDDDALMPRSECLHGEPGEGSVSDQAYIETTSPYDHVPKTIDHESMRQRNTAIEARLASLRKTNAARHVEAKRQRDLLIEERLVSLKQANIGSRILAEQLAKELHGLAAKQQSQDVESRKTIDQALRVLDEQDYEALRQRIAFDLGMTGFVVEMLDEETIRLILHEHGIEQDAAD